MYNCVQLYPCVCTVVQLCTDVDLSKDVEISTSVRYGEGYADMSPSKIGAEPFKIGVSQSLSLNPAELSLGLSGAAPSPAGCAPSLHFFCVDFPGLPDNKSKKILSQCSSEQWKEYLKLSTFNIYSFINLKLGLQQKCNVKFWHFVLNQVLK